MAIKQCIWKVQRRHFECVRVCLRQHDVAAFDLQALLASATPSPSNAYGKCIDATLDVSM